MPSGDHGDHFRIAIQHKLMLEEGIAAFLGYIKSHGGKPILHAVYALPLLILTQNNILLTAKIFFALSYTFLALSVFLFVKQFLKTNLSLSITTLLITGFRVFLINTQFMPEAIWLLFTFSGLGLAASEILHPSRKHRVGMTVALVFFALATLTRPVESFIVIYPLLASIVIAYLRIHEKSKVERSKILVSLLFFVSALYLVLVFLVLLETSNSWSKNHESILLFFGQFVLGFFLMKLVQKMFSSRQSQLHFKLFASTLSVFVFITSWWFVNYANALYGWAFSNTFGEIALQLDQFNAEKNFLQVLFSILYDYQYDGVGLSICFLSLTLIFWKKRSLHLSLIEWKKVTFLSLVIISSAFSFLVFTYIYLKTGVSEPRRLLVCLGVFVTSSLTYSMIFLKRLNVSVLVSCELAIVATTFFNIFHILPSAISCNPWNSLTDPFRATKICHSPKSFEREYVQKIRELGIQNSRIISLTPFTVLSQHLGFMVVPQPIGSTYRTFEPEVLRYASLVYDESPERNIYGTCWSFVPDEQPRNGFQRILNSGVDYILIDSVPAGHTDGSSTRKLVGLHLHLYNNLIEMIKKDGTEDIKELDLVYEFNYSETPVFLFRLNKEVVASYLDIEDTCYGTEEGILVEGDFWGFNIIQAGFGKFYAIPQGEGEFKLERFKNGDYSCVFEEESLAKIKQKINQVCLELEDVIPGVILVEEGFLGFNIVQVGSGEFYAVPQGEGEFTLERFKSGSYSCMFESRSLAEVKQKINQACLFKE